MEKIILLDTSFLIACAEFKIDYFSEFERIFSSNYSLVIIDKVLAELNHLAATGELKKRLAAKLAKTIVEKKKIKIVETKNKKDCTDDAIISVSDGNTIVATIDGELKRRLKSKGISVLVVRQKKYIEMLQA